MRCTHCAGRRVLGAGEEARSGGGRGAGEEGCEGDRVLPGGKRAPHWRERPSLRPQPQRVGVGAHGALLLPVRRRRQPHRTAA